MHKATVVNEISSIDLYLSSSVYTISHDFLRSPAIVIRLQVLENTSLLWGTGLKTVPPKRNERWPSLRDVWKESHLLFSCLLEDSFARPTNLPSKSVFQEVCKKIISKTWSRSLLALFVLCIVSHYSSVDSVAIRSTLTGFDIHLYLLIQ